MVQLRTYQANFTGGELSPSMQSRTDVSKYQSGVKLARNFQLKPQGGLRFRNGFEQVGEVIDSDFESWLIPFTVAEQEAYVLEFGENVLRFIRDGSYVLDNDSEMAITGISASSPAVVTTDGSHSFEDGDRVFIGEVDDANDVSFNFYIVRNPSGSTFELENRWGDPVDRSEHDTGGSGVVSKPYEIETPYSCQCASRLQGAQDQDTMFLFSHDHPPHRLRRIEVDEWELEEEEFKPTIEPPSGMVAVSSKVEVSTDGAAPGSYERKRNGSARRVRRIDGGGLPFPMENGDKITILSGSNGADVGETFTISNVDVADGRFEYDGGYSLTSWTSVSWAWEDDDSYEPGGAAPGVYEISAGNPAVATRIDGEPIDAPLENGDVIFFASLNDDGNDLVERTFTVANVDDSAGTFELEGVDRSNEQAAQGRWASAAPFDEEDRVYAYRIASISRETGEESIGSPFISQTMNDLSIEGNTNELRWPRQDDATLYALYKSDNGVFGFIGTTDRTRFTDENITADVSDTPQRLRNPFEGEGNWPKTGTFFEQRLWMANTVNNPSGVWASQSTEARNFNISRPVRDDDAITFSVRGQRITTIEALLPTESLIMLTAGGEWLVRGSEANEVLTPTNLILRQRAFRGSDEVPPLLVGDTVLHVQRGGNAIRDFRVTREIESTEISLIARHLFDFHHVKDWTYSQSPDSVVWVIRDDGKLLSLTYLLEHEIWGWTQHDLSGEDAFAESITSVPEEGVDAVYVTVRRTINGQTKRYVHRLYMREPDDAEDVFHVDAGLRYEGEPTEVLFGLDHLEGETLVGVFDGNVVRDLVVENGKVEVPVEFEKASIGLPYTGRMETLDLDLGPMQDAGSVLGRFKTISEVTLRVVRTRGIFIGQARGNQLFEHRQRATEDWNEPIALFTGDITITPEPDWDTSGTLIVEQRDPLPATITGLVTQWEFGE